MSHKQLIMKGSGPHQTSHRASGAGDLNPSPGTDLTLCDLGEVTLLL